MGGWTAYSKLDQIVALPVQSVSLATATFVGQNLGKNQIDRAKEGTRKSIYISWCFLIGAVILLEPFAPVFVRFFNSDPAVVRYGCYFVRIIVPTFFFFAIYQPLAAAMRGAGNAKAPMYGMLLGGVLFRQVYLFTMSRLFPGQELVIALAYPLGWVVCSVYNIICYRRQNYSKTRLVKD